MQTSLNAYVMHVFCFRRDNGRTIELVDVKIADNLWMSPYNPFLLRKYNCHFNLHIVTIIKSVYEGSDRLQAAILSLQKSGHPLEM